MGKSLVIVESRATAKALARLLGDRFVVKACNGPIKRLALPLGPDFATRYSVIEAQQKTLANLREAARGVTSIFLAAGAGGAGEMLCHHLQQEFARTAATYRVLLPGSTGLTAAAVRRAFAQPQPLNHNQIDAQHARAVMSHLASPAEIEAFAGPLAAIARGEADWRLVLMDFVEQSTARQGPEARLARGKPSAAEPRTTKARTVSPGTCPQCRAPLVRRTGPREDFTGCSAFPKCRYVQPKDAPVPCPACSAGHLVEKRSAAGRLFYGCHRFPGCDFRAWGRPVAEKCPACSSPYLLAKADGVQCPNRQCKWKKDVAP